MNQMKFITCFFIILLPALCFGCRTVDEDIQFDQGYPIEMIETTEIIEAYPNTAIPSPETQLDDIELLVIPNPSTDTGVVTGQLLSSEPAEQPYLSTLYLGETIYADGQEESPPIISFSEFESLIGIQDEQTGQFIFTDVPPGEYALIIWTPVFSMVMRDPETETDILFRVEPGAVTDLGVLKVR